MTRDAIMIEFALRHVVYGGGYSADAVDWSINAMADEIVRLRSILAALRGPSQYVKESVQSSPHDVLLLGYHRITVILQAAVAAAEREVAG